MENKTETVLKNTEGQEVCTCIDCKKNFTPFEYDDQCGCCKDGEYLYLREDYEGGDLYATCPYCKGHGSFTLIEKLRCKSCHENDLVSTSYGDDY